MICELLSPGSTDGTILAREETLADLRALELATLAADGDPVIEEQLTARFRAPGIAPWELGWRHALLLDATRQPEELRSLYRTAQQAALLEPKAAWLARETSVHAGALRCRELFRALLPLLDAARTQAAHIEGSSKALCRLKELLEATCDPRLLGDLGAAMEGLRPSGHLEISLGLGPTNLPARLALHRPAEAPRTWWARRRIRRHAIALAPYDQAAIDALRDLVAAAMAPAVQEAIAGARAYVAMMVFLRDQLAWVVGAVTLIEACRARGIPLAIARPASGLTFTELVDPVLALTSHGAVVPSSLAETDASALVVRGANSGGKTTWLRSLGLALLCQRVGLPVTAREFACQPTTSLATLFPRDEAGDAGLFSHELACASSAIDDLRPGGWLLANEPLSSTHTHLGSRIVAELTTGICAAGARVALVTHAPPILHELEVLALTTVQDATGRPTYEIVPGAPPEGGRAMTLLAELGGWPG